jgi:hypothetical protein
VPITLGLLYHFEIYFPPGPSGLLHIQLYDGSHQIFPANEGTDYIGDNVTITVEDLYPKLSAPDELQIWAWNEDDTFTQTAIVRFSILPPDAFSARFSPQLASDQLQQIITLLTAANTKTLSPTAAALLSTFTPTPSGGGS